MDEFLDAFALMGSPEANNPCKELDQELDAIRAESGDQEIASIPRLSWRTVQPPSTTPQIRSLLPRHALCANRTELGEKAVGPSNSSLRNLNF